MNKLIDFGFDQKAKIWYESPDYSTTVLGIICDFANMLDEKAGIDLFKQRPILTEAVKTSAEYLFPNRMIAGFGDTHPGYLNTGGIDGSHQVVLLVHATSHRYPRYIRSIKQGARICLDLRDRSLGSHCILQKIHLRDKILILMARDMYWDLMQVSAEPSIAAWTIRNIIPRCQPTTR